MKSKLFAKKYCFGIVLLLISFMVIGSFYDFQLSSALYNPKSFFGILFASYGQLPAMLCFSVAGILLIKIRDPKKKGWQLFSCIIGGLLTILAILGIMMDPMLYIPHMSMIISLIIAVCIVILVDVIVWRLCVGTDRRNIKKFIIIILGVMLLEMIIINIIKVPWARPRMRLIVEQPEVAFQSWWMIGNDMKAHFMALGIAGEEFKSFPSGHTGNATCAIMLGLLPLLSVRLKGKETMLFFIGVLFTCVVAFSRIIMGAHFLSDVTIGMSCAFIVEVIFVYFVIKKDKKLSESLTYQS